MDNMFQLSGSYHQVQYKEHKNNTEFMRTNGIP